MTERPRLLIVDDQPANVRLLAEALQGAYELYFATSGERALEIAGNGSIELVLLDVVMPGMDGFEVCRQLKDNERTRRIPVVFVTAREEVTDEERGFEVGGVDYINKPIRPSVVRARVRTHVELKRARDVLESIAAVDALTGIPNRRTFDTRLEQEWSRAARSGEPLCLALVDVDHFKRFNDSHGHARGDACLRAVATALAASARRPTDLVARYGGEEFGVVLPGTAGSGAVPLLGAMLGSVRDLGLEHSASDCAPHVTISGGAVTLRASHGRSAAAALQRADALLYEAKSAGRNRIVYVDEATGQKQDIV